MMKLTVPKSKSKNPNVRLFYVTSEATPDSKEDVHIVVQHGALVYDRGVGSFVTKKLYFCDCRDFMVRKVTAMETTGLYSASVAGAVTVEPCKHGQFVDKALALVPKGAKLEEAVKL